MAKVLKMFFYQNNLKRAGMLTQSAIKQSIIPKENENFNTSYPNQLLRKIAKIRNIIQEIKQY